MRKLKPWQIVCAIICALVAVLAASFFVFVSMGYKADSVALAEMKSSDSVKVIDTSYGYFFDGPSDECALVFYPGARVEIESYAPLMKAFAEAGIDAHLVSMPFGLSLDKDAAEEIMYLYSYEHWYIGGHSMGGAVAALFASEKAESLGIEAVVLCAAYATAKIPDSVTEIVLIGSNDKVCEFSKIEANRENAPVDYVEHVIEGGNHAQFGSYGAQRGDGVASISAEEQVEECVGVVVECLLNR